MMTIEKKILISIFALLIVITVFLTIFEITLYLFHSAFNQNILSLKTHNSIWDYLLYQEYISFIDLDIFTINEKRHLLDVKRLLEKINQIWLTLLFFSFAGVIIISFKKLWFSIISKIYLWSLILLIFLIMLSLNFLTNFNFLHSLFFIDNSWVFSQNSILIKLFPIIYFQQFFFIIIFFNMVFLAIYFKVYLSFVSETNE